MINCNYSQVFYYRNPLDHTLCLARMAKCQFGISPLETSIVEDLDTRLQILDVDVENMFGTDICDFHITSHSIVLRLNNGQVYLYLDSNTKLYLPVDDYITKIYDDIKFNNDRCLMFLTDKGELLLYCNNIIYKNPKLHNTIVEDFDSRTLVITNQGQILQISCNDFVEVKNYIESNIEYKTGPSWSCGKKFSHIRGRFRGTTLLIDDQHSMYELVDSQLVSLCDHRVKYYAYRAMNMLFIDFNNEMFYNNLTHVEKFWSDDEEIIGISCCHFWVLITDIQLYYFKYIVQDNKIKIKHQIPLMTFNSTKSATKI